MSKNFVDYGNATALMGGVADRIDKDKFIGTKAEWDRLTEEEKAVYNGRIVNITDDFTPGGGGVSFSYADNKLTISTY